MACRLTTAYSGGSTLQIGNVLYLSSSNVTGFDQLSTNGNLSINLPTISLPQAQVEIIKTDHTGHPVDGIPGTYKPKYDEGYKVGYDTGYDSGFTTGKQRGIDAGTATGRSDGYDKGYAETYQPAFDSAYNAQLPIGEAAGWNQGQINGFTQGYNWAPTVYGYGSVTISSGNYGGGVWGSSGTVMMNIGGGVISDLHMMSPDEVPAFYYKLGLDDGNTKGVSEGSIEGYKVTYADAYAAAFTIGYENGTTEGVSQGTANGETKGFNAGWELGYDPGFNSGFEAGVQHYLSGHQSSSSFGTLSIELGGYISMAPGSLLLGDAQAGDIGATGSGSDVASDTGVPEPTSFALLSIAIGAVSLRRAGRK